MVEMKPNELDQSLKQLATLPIPVPPPNLIASVLREIRLRCDSATSPVAALANWLWRGQVALASVPAAIVMGMVIALTWPVQEARSGASQALYLDVFSQYSPTLPSTYIDSGR
jgi:hypothetical protein